MKKVFICNQILHVIKLLHLKFPLIVYLLVESKGGAAIAQQSRASAALHRVTNGGALTELGGTSW